MGKIRRYEFEGLVLEIPMRYDAQAAMYIEEYPDFVENPLWTSEGHPVMFSGEDACILARESSPGGCPDCGACRFYRPLGEHTWIGICSHHQKNRNTEMKETRRGANQ